MRAIRMHNTQQQHNTPTYQRQRYRNPEENPNLERQRGGNPARNPNLDKRLEGISILKIESTAVDSIFKKKKRQGRGWGVPILGLNLLR